MLDHLHSLQSAAAALLLPPPPAAAAAVAAAAVVGDLAAEFQAAQKQRVTTLRLQRDTQNSTCACTAAGGPESRGK
jgi:streptogramin lyase